ncbi:MAG: FeoB small GTPase domain-containing protein [Terriglobia bacterium]
MSAGCALCEQKSCSTHFGLPVDANGHSVVALAGNPNTGKSSLFNALTGLRQHTGNWPGKTVLRAEGICSYRDRRFLFVDLPGTYSLRPHSPEEEVALDFLLVGQPKATVVVTDATCLERNLKFVLQVLEITPRVVVAVNLIDAARARGIHVDTAGLSRELGVPAVATNARRGEGLGQLLAALDDVVAGRAAVAPRPIWYEPPIEAALQELESQLLLSVPNPQLRRWLALRLLEGESRLPWPGANSMAGERT